MLAHSASPDTATFAFEIPREELVLALNQFAQQCHIEIAYSAELTRGKISPSLRGTYTPEQALTILLKGSGLHGRRIASGALVIEKEGAGKSPAGGHRPTLDHDATAQIGEIIIIAAKHSQMQRQVAGLATANGGDATPSGMSSRWPCA